MISFHSSVLSLYVPHVSNTLYCIIANLSISTSHRYTSSPQSHYLFIYYMNFGKTHPIIYMSAFTSVVFSPNKEVTSSGGTADPTFHETMQTLEKSNDLEGIPWPRETYQQAAFSKAVYMRKWLVICHPDKHMGEQLRWDLMTLYTNEPTLWPPA